MKERMLFVKRVSFQQIIKKFVTTQFCFELTNGTLFHSRVITLQSASL
jgi:hypothetical protein